MLSKIPKYYPAGGVRGKGGTGGQHARGAKVCFNPYGWMCTAMASGELDCINVTVDCSVQI